MLRKEVKKGYRKLSFLLALALVASLVLNVTFMDVKVQAADPLPRSHNGKQYQTPARNQKQSNLCWAYSTIAALEAAAVKQMGENKDTLDFSEFHLAYFTFAGGHDDLDLTNNDTVSFHSGNYLDNGANPQYPMAALTGGIGPVLESVVSTEQIFKTDGYVKDNATSIKLDEALRRGGNAYDVDTVYTMLINNNSSGTSNRDAVKRAIMECGAVATSYWSAEHGQYYKSQDGSVCCYYQNGVKSFDHGIAVVGWDDDFSKDNFHPNKRPSNNGAWLVKNSWGNNTIYTDKDGYFWISYEDASFAPTDEGRPNFAYGYKLRRAGQYKHIYQYDGGIIHEFNKTSKDNPSNPGYTNPDNIGFANIYTAKDNYTLDAIALQTDQGYADAACSLQVYVDVGTNPVGGRKVYEQNFTIPINGFFTIPLTTSVEINKDQKFSVVVMANQNTLIATDRDYAPSDSPFSVFNHTEPNQSFIINYFDSNWSDLHNEHYYSYEQGTSLCIKALMNDRGSGTGTTITLDNQSPTTPGTASITATKGQAMPAITIPVKTGYTFDGYYSEINGGGTKYYNANGTSARNWDSDTITTFYAKWIHNHSFTYSASGGDLIATCGNPGCNLTNSKLTLTLTASDSTYSGSAHSGATISGDATNWKSYTGLDIPTINYTGSNSYNSATPPTNVGSYVATITAGIANATCSFSINKATYSGVKVASAFLTKREGSTVTVSLPSIPAGGSYGTVVNSNDTLFSVGTPSGGSVLVTALSGVDGASGNKTFMIPVQSDNYDDYDITVTISLTDKQTQSISANDVTATYPSTNTNNSSVTISSDSSTNVNVQVSNNNVTIPAIRESAINSIISNTPTTNEVKEVTIDLSKVNSNVTSVTITKDMVETIAKVLSHEEDIKESFSFKLPNVTITLDDKAVNAIAEQAKANEIRIVVLNTTTAKLTDSQKDAIAEINKKENASVAQTFEAYMVSGTERISDFKGGTVRVSKIDFKMPASKNPKFYHVYYLPDKGEPVRHETWYEGGALHFRTGHFSDYAIVYDEAMENGQARPVYRLWNHRNGDHLLTTNVAEKELCEKAGWRYEGVAFLVANNGKKVYRLYNPRTGEHFYTQSEGEKNACEKAGWNYEGIAFTTDGEVEIYRLYNGMHHFTANADEREYLEKLGWTYEGIGFKAN